MRRVRWLFFVVLFAAGTPGTLTVQADALMLPGGLPSSEPETDCG